MDNHMREEVENSEDEIHSKKMMDGEGYEKHAQEPYSDARIEGNGATDITPENSGAQSVNDVNDTATKDPAQREKRSRQTSNRNRAGNDDYHYDVDGGAFKKLMMVRNSTWRRSAPAAKPLSTGKAPKANGTGPGRRSLNNQSNSLSSLDKKRQDDVLKLIAYAKAKTNRPAVEIKPLPVGQFTVTNLSAAVTKGLNECHSLLLNWNAGPAKRIGKRCKVFWDGDEAWYYARVLNYDSHFDMHFIYYESDNTVEWINLNNETVLVAEDIQLAKYGSSMYPCLTYWISSKGREALKKLKGYKNGGEFIEYFNETGFGEYSFSNVKSLQPLEMQSRGRPNKKMDSYMASAQAEQAAVDNVVELVLPAIKKLAFEKLVGDQWIGLHVRTATNLVNVREDKRNATSRRSTGSTGQNSAMCIGTITNYCASEDKVFIVFDEDHLQPQWVPCKGDTIELLITPAEIGETSPSESFIRCMGPISSEDCAMCGLGKSDADRLPTQCSWLMRCSCCNLSYHEYCLPINHYADESLENAIAEFNCGKCKGCFNCHRTAWESPLISWNVSNVLSSVANHSGPSYICGTCLEHYIVTKDFCPLCGGIYGAFDKLKSHDADSKQTSQADMMVQCNECDKWVHASCDGIDEEQYDAITRGFHPVWGDEYLCPDCRITISINVINNLTDLDTSQMFAEPVTEKLAANYFDIIRNPMDLSTMRGKAQRGQYKALQSLRQDFELMCLNALVFNKTGDEYWNDSRHYHSRAMAEVFDHITRKTTLSAYGTELQTIIQSFAATQTTKAIENDSFNTRRKRTAASHGLLDFVDEKGNDVAPTKRRRSRFRSELTESAAIVGSDDMNNDKRMTESSNETKAIGSHDDMEIVIDGADPATVTASKDLIANTKSEQDVSSESQMIVSTDHIVKMDDDSALEEKNLSSNVKSEAVDSFPSQLEPVNTPLSYSNCSAVTLSLDKAFLEAFIDVCLVCGSSDARPLMLHCIDCGESYHSFCAEVPLTFMSKDHRLQWRCANCKVCEICGDASESDSSSLIYCDNCDKSFHLHCLSPPVQSIQSKAQWFCESCVGCKGSERNHCWGTERGKCHNCLPIAKPVMKDLIIAVAKESQKSNASLISPNHSIPSNISLNRVERSLCDKCGIEIKAESFLRCYLCSRHSHPQCSPNINQQYLWLKSNSKDWICRNCETILVNRDRTSDTYTSHLGPMTKAKVSILSMVSLVQRKRINFSREVRCNATNGFDKIMQSKWSEERRNLVAIFNWAIRRAQRLLSPRPNLSGVNEFDSRMDCAYWSHQRAHRFLALIRLKVAKYARKQSMEGRGDKSGIKDYLNMTMKYSSRADDSQAIWKQSPSIQSLGRKSTLAAAFIRHTDVDKEHKQRDEDLEAEVKIMLSSLQGNLSGEISDQQLSETAASIMELQKQLLLQPIGLRDITLPTKFIEGLSPTASHDASSIVSLENSSVETYLPHWAPGGSMKCQSTSNCDMNGIESNGRLKLLKSVKRADYSVKEKQSEAKKAASNPPIKPAATSAYSSARPALQSFDLNIASSGYYAKKLRDSLPVNDEGIVCPGYQKYIQNQSAVMLPSDALENVLLNLKHLKEIFVEWESSQSIVEQISNATSHGESATSNSIGQNENAEIFIDTDKQPSNKSMQSKTVQEISLPSYQDVTIALAKSDTSNIIAGDNILPPPDFIPTASGSCHMGWNSSSLALPPSSGISNLKEENHDSNDLISDDMAMNPSTDTINALEKPSHANSINNSSADTSGEWFNHRLCCLCKLPADSFHGRVLVFADGIGAHVNCLRWSFEVYEKSNILINATKARDRGMRTRCWYCDERGASSNCKSCRRIYHLRCAHICLCTFVELKYSNEADNSHHSIHSQMYCPEHFDVFQSQKMAAVSLRCIPTEPIRPLHVDDYYTVDTVDLAEVLSQKRSDVSVRSGGLIIHAMGSVNPQLFPGFATREYIYPHKFISSRIFWSMTKPWQRCVYVMEIMRTSDIDYYGEIAKDKEIQAIVDSRRLYGLTTEQKERLASLGLNSLLESLDAKYSHAAPIFRIKWFDLQSEKSNTANQSNDDLKSPPLYTRSLEEAFALIISHVVLWQQSSLISHRVRKHYGKSYGLDPHQFFGIGLPCVRHAIERIPESVAAMIYPSTTSSKAASHDLNHSRYLPRYHLPSHEAVTRIKSYLQMQKSWGERSSLLGCFKADPVARHSAAFQSKKFNKTLTKAVDDSPENVATNTGKSITKLFLGILHENHTCNDESMLPYLHMLSYDECLDPYNATPSKGVDEQDDDDQVNSQRILSNKYHILSANYLEDPYLTLLVRKSNIHGYGLFARTSFSKNDMIVEYIGEKIRQAIADRREVMYEEEGVGSCYLFRQDKDSIIDATRTGGMARFMNHCCEPNAYARIISALPSRPNSSHQEIEDKHIVIMAARDISPGEEITYDYKFPIEENKLKCYCNATKCLGFMN